MLYGGVIGTSAPDLNPCPRDATWSEPAYRGRVTARRVLVGAAAALALFALVIMHGLPLAASNASPEPTVHAMPMAASHEGHSMPERTGAAMTQTSPDAPAPHEHTLAHLCLAVLTGALLLLLLVVRRRPLGADLAIASLAARVRTLVPRAVGPPALAELGLLRC
jgi:hypothetical protein